MTGSIFARPEPTIVGVVNVTPDSFSDGGLHTDGTDEIRVDSALAAARTLVADGAHIIDVGGESTRPGAAAVPAAVEIDRTIPVIRALVQALPEIPISIDTRKSDVAAAALEVGATIINDISGLGFDLALADLAAERDATLILGHLRGTPAEMQVAPHFDDVLREVASELQHSVDLARRAGVSDDRLVIDPGIGFGKELGDNLELIAHARWLRDRLALPLLLGHSRKSFLGSITGARVEARDPATHAVCAIAAFLGVDAVRVHDAGGARQALAVGRALREARRKELS